MRLRRASGFAVTLGLLTATVALAPSTAGAGGTPLWVKHVRNYPGGISGAVRATDRDRIWNGSNCHVFHVAAGPRNRRPDERGL